jgi:indolepyruvate ferredoxin oxidoreductase, beta subunit
MSSERPIKLTIAALGGQGGGVLASWLVEIADAEGYLAQTTSVPGVAQRTGATIYYLEFFPKSLAAAAGRDPVMALMPVPGDVDCVLASELVEAGRAIQRGLVTRDRTTLIASSHRSYSISEKSALGDGTANAPELIDLVRSQAQRLILFDMDAVAESHHSVISSVMLGALGGSGVLPFRKAAFEETIRKGGIAVSTNLAAFEDAYVRAQRADGDIPQPGSLETARMGTPRAPGSSVYATSAASTGTAARVASGGAAPATGVIPTTARSAHLQPLLEQVRTLPALLQEIALTGVQRALDYQDPGYADLYLQRLRTVSDIDDRQGGGPDGQRALSLEVARSLALWMTFEDTIRVADLKTRPARFERVRTEIRADEGQLFGVTEFMKPRVQEIAGTLPARLGHRVLRSARATRWLERWTGGRQIRTGTIGGFLLLYALGALKRWRRGTLRYHEENARIEDWLSRIASLAADHYELAVELARAQRLVKGYGETHERGWRNFSVLVQQLDTLARRADGASILSRLQTAALADEEGAALAKEIAGLRSAGAPATAPLEAVGT